MTVLEAIGSRRSVRKYSDKPIEQQTLNKILEAARLAPSAGNAQHWKFVVVTSPSLRQALAKACGGQMFIAQAGAAVVAVGTKPGIMTNEQPAEAVDLSIALAYLILEAHEQGLGTCWIANYNQAQVKKLLGIPEGCSVVAVTPLGYPEEAPAARSRKSLEEIVCFDGYR